MNKGKLLLGALSTVALIGFAGPIQPSGSTQQAPPIVRAQRFELVDRSGRTRIAMSMNSETGAAGISMYDGVATLPRIIVGTGADGSAGIAHDDSNGNKRAEFSLNSEMVRLSITDPALKGGVVLGSSADRTAIRFNDDTSKPRAVLGLTPAHEPNLTLYDQKQKPIWSNPPSLK